MSRLHIVGCVNLSYCRVCQISHGVAFRFEALIESPLALRTSQVLGVKVCQRKGNLIRECGRRRYFFQKLIGYLTSEGNGFLETKNRLDRHCQNHFLCDDAIARIGECEMPKSHSGCNHGRIDVEYQYTHVFKWQTIGI